MANEKELRAAAKELNEVLGLKPPLNVKAKLDVLTKEVVDAIGLIEPNAPEEEGNTPKSYSDETLAIIRELNPDVFPEEDAPEEVPEPAALLEEVEACDSLADLKEIAKGNDEFKAIRTKLISYKKVEDLKDKMLEILNEEAEAAQEAAEDLHKKNIKTAPTRTSAKEAPKKGATTKTGGGRPANFKKEGSYAEFLDNRVKEGGSWDDILSDAQAEAETRGKKTALGTIKAHVKFRLSKDAKFLGKLKVTEDGIE
jgi:hypothetical protein